MSTSGAETRSKLSTIRRQSVGVKTPWAWFRNLLARSGQDPVQITRYVLPYPIAGVNLQPDDILSLSAVWGCIDAIARGIGQCDLNVYAPRAHGRRDLLDDDPLMYLLNTRPNPEMTAIGFREAMLFQAIPYGNAYAEIVPNGFGQVKELWPLPSDRVTPRRDPATWDLVYHYRQPSGEVVVIPARRIFHLRGPGLYGLMGENLIARAAKSMAVAAAQERYSASFFGQGANPGGVLKFPGVLGADQHKLLKEDFAERTKGPENAHKPLILESGMEWEATGIDPQKSQLVEGRKFSVEEICRWFGVPPHKIQHLEHATFSNIEHQSIEFVRDAVNPWNKRFEQEADYKLFHQDRQRGPWKTTGFDTTPLLSGDSKSRAESYAIMRQNGIMNANEIRALEKMNGQKGADGDVYLVQSNLTTVDRIVNPPAPPPSLALPPGAAAVDDTEDPADEADPSEEPDTEAAAVARSALTAIVVGALERYSRAVANRRTDLRGHTSADVLEGKLTALRAQLWPRLLDELEAAQPFAARALGRALVPDALRLAAGEVDAGATPELAATRLLLEVNP